MARKLVLVIKQLRVDTAMLLVLMCLLFESILTVVDLGTAYRTAIDIPYHLVVCLGLVSVRGNKMIQ